MKFLLCLVFVPLIVTAQLLTTEKQWTDECRAETGVSIEALDQVRHNDFCITDDKIDAFILCFGKKSGVFNASGDVDVEKLKAKLKTIVNNEDQVNEVIAKCVDKKETKEERAFRAFKCVRRSYPEFKAL
ncbi:hypothetical protein Zmor_019905 [Zophobas morio]|uniref:Uncharacterized protein n=1 Tax=Zophobas morio TaxID=2755281 RepID=A0AA38M9H2_9CUCU|nr:hypothetical protein Zmor_019905 [Zophobas morio]